MTASYAFIPDPGTNFTAGEEPAIATRLTMLAKELHANIYGISGYRSPAHSTEVGGSSNDPHTKGQAADVGVNGSLRSSATQLTNSELAKVGLWRPFDLTGQDPAEVNHIQLLPSAGGPNVAGVSSTASATKAEEKKLEGEASGPGLIGQGLGDIGSAGKAVLNAPGELITGGVSDVAGEVASGLFGDIKEAFGADFVKGLLYVVLAGGGAVLVITGISRSTGLHPAQGAKKVATVAATGAVLA
jgi:hypothetical protein